MGSPSKYFQQLVSMSETTLNVNEMFRKSTGFKAIRTLRNFLNTTS